jgi:hypothetical protein
MTNTCEVSLDGKERKILFCYDGTIPLKLDGEKKVAPIEADIYLIMKAGQVVAAMNREQLADHIFRQLVHGQLVCQLQLTES